MHSKNKNIFLKNVTAVIGIDIAKYTHYASVVIKKSGKLVKTGIKIQNTRFGFESFVEQIKEWEPNEVMIGMEPTGHYWKVINSWLLENGYKTVLVNPYHVKLHKELHNNMNNKNDIKDSQIIAKIVSREEFLTVTTVEKKYDELREFSLARDGLIKDLGRKKTQLKALFDQFLPEFSSCFSDLTGKTSIALLETFSIAGLTNKAHKTKKINLITKVSRGAIRKEKAEKIVLILSESIGVKGGLCGAAYKLKTIIRQIKLYKEEIAEVKKNLKIYLEQVEEAQYMLSVRGVGSVTVSAFLGQTGSLEKFSHPHQLQKFAGMLPSQSQSGKFKGQTKLSKRGNSKLRRVMYLIAVSLISNNKEIGALYRHKLDVLKKKKFVALTAIAVKALRILFKLGKSKIFYNEKLVQESLKIA